ncbi:barstar family protein [Streptomyces sp. NPDC059991]|uniref:barstar family protein n=1 Tax=Streptomyces sp. NPDC059991 TaxID=3347028 RepID=UPI0036C3B1B0
MVIDPGLREVSGADIARILDEAARQGVPAFALSTGGRTDQEAFFKAVQAALSLDPPLKAVRRVWEALADSLWDGPHALNAPRVVIVWPDAHPVAGAQGDFEIALDVLREMVTSLAEAQYTGGRPTRVSVYIAPAANGRQHPGV